jgi:hypothetical protein
MAPRSPLPRAPGEPEAGAGEIARLIDPDVYAAD